MNATPVAETLVSFEPGVFSLVVYGFLVLVLVAFLLFLSGWLGEKKKGPEKLRPYSLHGKEMST